MPPNVVPMDVLVPSHPITLEEYLTLDLVDEWGNSLSTELVAGMVVVSPAPGRHHETAKYELAAMLHAALPAGYRVSGGDWIVVPEPYATVREPDLVVVAEAQAWEVRMSVAPPLLAVEVVSPRSSVERDLVAKRREYAEAGCPHYWVLVPDRPELVRFRLDDREYVEAGRTTGRRRVRVTEPFAVTIDLARVIA